MFTSLLQPLKPSSTNNKTDNHDSHILSIREVNIYISILICKYYDANYYDN